MIIYLHACKIFIIYVLILYIVVIIIFLLYLATLFHVFQGDPKHYFSRLKFVLSTPLNNIYDINLSCIFNTLKIYFVSKVMGSSSFRNLHYRTWLSLLYYSFEKSQLQMWAEGMKSGGSGSSGVQFNTLSASFLKLCFLIQASSLPTPHVLQDLSYCLYTDKCQMYISSPIPLFLYTCFSPLG